MMVTFKDVTAFLDVYLQAERFEDDVTSIFVPGTAQLERLGLALEPDPSTATWIRDENLDALWLHRPWGVGRTTLPEGLGVLAHHLAFDERLTLGYNLRLADLLSLENLDVLGYKEGRPLGMIGENNLGTFPVARALFEEMFGGLERSHAGHARPIRRVAVVGAMNRRFVWEASERGADLYLTGQWREHAEKALAETGLSVITVGHARSERWGLKALAHVLRERFGGLEVIRKS